MSLHPLVVADWVRVEQFHLLARTSSLFHEYDLQVDGNGVPWAVRWVGDHGFAVSALGPGWVFDPFAQQQRADDLVLRRQKLAPNDPCHHRQLLDRVIEALRLGPLSLRILFAVHQRVVQAAASVFRVPEAWLRQVVWGDTHPKHWRSDLCEILKSLTQIHVCTRAEPQLGANTALLTHSADLHRDAEADVCVPDCPGWEGPPHHHILVNVGRGFLGVLERFAHESDSGVRAYHFPVAGAKHDVKTLKKVGKTGRLGSVYLPALIGEPAACGRFTARQHRLLQTVHRQLTRTKPHKAKSSQAAEFTGNRILPFSGRAMTACPGLDPAGAHVGFNGNKVRSGRGHLLCSAGGWLAKAGYAPDELAAFLDDVQALALPLGLVVVGVQPGQPPVLTLDQIHGLAATPAGRCTLAKAHIRIYSAIDYLERWNAVFHWPGPMVTVPTSGSADNAGALGTLLQKRGLTQKELADGIGIDNSYLSKVLRGRKPCPDGLLAKARMWLEQQEAPKPLVPHAPSSKGFPADDPLAAALAYCARGWSVVPQLPGAKQPAVRWKPYQSERPTEAQLRVWFQHWPETGLALVLGPVSQVVAIDVDGPEAHAALLERLGEEPWAPKALSGSRQPHRYHLFFACPNFPTKAKATPWHPKLEFRGQGGVLILPPSVHPRGQRYAWCAGQALDEVPLPALPPLIAAAWNPPPKLPPVATVSVSVHHQVAASSSTQEFLAGKWANGPGWNDRLFRAACDLCGRRMSREQAEPLLLAGAQPWDEVEQEKARRTIASAFSTARLPAIG